MQEVESKVTTRAITAQDWKDIERELKSLYSQVKLVCDGYSITVCLEQISQLKNAIAVYVNGKINLKWLFEDCEERRRFYCQKSRSVYSKKDLAAFKKISKKIFKEMQAKKIIYYDTHWTSFRSLKAHLIKQNKVIELVVADERS